VDGGRPFVEIGAADRRGRSQALVQNHRGGLRLEGGHGQDGGDGDGLDGLDHGEIPDAMDPTGLAQLNIRFIASSINILNFI
jgi:hypothetical protein